ncbi:MAG: fimbria/pilus outer membrane usher protein, partial [Fibrobacter sp.]|nr:fimbria/pilus outer membrane usher protein [Fibrobacter sp.]
MAKKTQFNLFVNFTFKFCLIILFFCAGIVLAQSDTASLDTSAATVPKQGEAVTDTAKDTLVQDSAKLFDTGKNVSAEDFLGGADTAQKTVKKNSYQEQLENYFANKTPEELYQEFFGIPAPPKPKEIKALIEVNDKRGIQADVIFAEDGENFSISYTPIIEMLARTVGTELLDSIKAKSDSLGRISNTALDSLRLFTKLDLNNYLITIFVPPELRTLQEHQLRSVPENPYIYPSTKPSKVSGYVNISATQQLKYLQDISFDTSALYSYYGTKTDIRQPLYSNFDAALNIFNAVVEGGFQYDESRKDKPFTRRDVMLVYDIPQSALRLSAGDIYYATSGYQSSIPLGGISISKDYSLTPHVLTYPVGEQEFRLEEKAEVEVWLNEVMVKRMVLDPGTHNINNFPFVSGQNEVKIVIRDFSGREETINFSFLYEGQLLAKGISQYSFAAGFPSYQVNYKYRYEDDKPFVSAMYRRGITNQFTLETYGQAFDNAGLFGAEGLYAVPFGNFAFSMAVSGLKNSDADMAARLSFQNRRQKKEKDIDESEYFDDADESYEGYENDERDTDKNWLSWTNWRISAEYTGGKFKRSSAKTTSLLTNALRLGLNWSIPLELLGIGVGSEYTVRRDTTDYFAINVNLNKSWPKGISTNMGFRYVTDSRGKVVNPAITIRAQWSFFKKSNYLSVNQGIDKRKVNNTDAENKND